MDSQQQAIADREAAKKQEVETERLEKLKKKNPIAYLWEKQTRS
jgi:hypothetical protein